MSNLTQEQKEAYWKYNIRLTTILLVIWFVVTYLFGGLWAETLNNIVILGFPLGYYMAAQGSLIIYVVIIWTYAIYMNKLDRRYGVHEGEDD